MYNSIKQCQSLSCNPHATQCIILTFSSTITVILYTTSCCVVIPVVYVCTFVSIKIVFTSSQLLSKFYCNILNFCQVFMLYVLVVQSANSIHSFIIKTMYQVLGTMYVFTPSLFHHWSFHYKFTAHNVLTNTRLPLLITGVLLYWWCYQILHVSSIGHHQNIPLSYRRSYYCCCCSVYFLMTEILSLVWSFL